MLIGQQAIGDLLFGRESHALEGISLADNATVAFGKLVEGTLVVALEGAEPVA